MVLAFTPHASLEFPTTPSIPEPGQVVEVRGSTWAVADVREQGLPRSPADESRAGIHHVVTLQSLDEDRLGEELTVVWELEVGHTVAPDQGLPETDHRRRVRRPEHAWRRSSTPCAGVRSPRPTPTPTRRRSAAAPTSRPTSWSRCAARCRRPRTNLLLADDVGLGKTIEAGLVIQELLLRHRARSVVIVCPPSLALKWQDEMREKFGLDFVIVNSELMAEVRRSHGLDANPFRLFPRVIVSMAWLPSLRAQRLLRDVYAQVGRTNSARRFAFDVLVVDEAHHVAPASPTHGRRQPRLRRRQPAHDRHPRAGRALRAPAVPQRHPAQRAPGVVHRAAGDDRRPAVQPGRVSSTSEALREVTVRRLKTELHRQGLPAAARSSQLPFTPSDGRAAGVRRPRRICCTASARRNGRAARGDIVAMLLKKRFLSSPWAFATHPEPVRAAAAAGVGCPTWTTTTTTTPRCSAATRATRRRARSSSPSSPPCGSSKGSDPLVAATPGADRAADRLGPTATSTSPTPGWRR